MSTQHIDISQVTETVEERNSTQAIIPTIDQRPNRLAIIVSIIALYILWARPIWVCV